MTVSHASLHQFNDHVRLRRLLQMHIRFQHETPHTHGHDTTSEEHMSSGLGFAARL
jgi:hypothetical protein